MTLELKDVVGGLRVGVLRQSDETLHARYMGRVGKVVGFDPAECGASESDPMIMVYFPSLKKTDGFWLEELVPEEPKYKVALPTRGAAEARRASQA